MFANEYQIERIAQLKEIYDPEIPVDIFELGLKMTLFYTHSM